MRMRGSDPGNGGARYVLDVAADLGFPMEEEAGGLVVQLFALGLAGEGTVAVGGYSPRSVRRHLRRAGLPPPRRWVSLGRCVAALRRARSPSVSFERAALASGWGEASAFYRSCRTLLGDVPSGLVPLPDEQLVVRFLRAAPSRDPD